LIIALDGVPFTVVRELHDKGMLPAFYPPGPMVTVYPAMSDIAFARVFGSETPLGFEAQYYVRETGQLSDGNRSYLAGVNEPWSKLLDYRLSNFWSAVQYVAPKWFFRREVENLVREFRDTEDKVFVAYFASTAGIGTRFGRAGYIEALLEIDRLARQLVIESKGEVTVTLLSDHGHSLTPARRAPIEDFLAERGWRIVKRLERPRDVVLIAFGLVTYAGLYTDSPAELAQALVSLPHTTLCSYRERDAVVVMSRDGSARVTRREERYRYEAVEGDPLNLLPVIAALSADGKVDQDRYVDDRALLKATAGLEYPDPLKRLWECFNGVAQHPADVVVSLRDDCFFGKRGFEGATAVRSTHGSLNRANSLAFVMSTAGRVGEAIRVDDFREAMQRLGIPLRREEGSRPF